MALPSPSTIFRRARNSHQASVMDVPDEAEPAARLYTPNTMPLDGLRYTAQTTASSLSRHRRSPPPIASRVGIEGASVPAPTPTGTSVTTRNANILRTMFNHSSNNSFDNVTFTNPARDSYSFNGPVTFTVNLDLINRMLQSIGLRGLDPTPSVSISDLQVPASLRPWVDADTLERGDGPQVPTMGTNQNTRSGLRGFINGYLFRAQDTHNLAIAVPIIFF
ncbi:hypothetical protein K435DRAFT_776342 [Dendrothele bispora CBS 962.96]|uniref:Uncharacterized protein n=1 Tax=Dendrothele bispora (strain CBS 962.96) TaxID=1314807 RepID=A0A4S8ME95_DENBC|nr:hypothetical protein K435DRAFT_776342 [Dendrothele bispora CBS 962.96]